MLAQSLSLLLLLTLATSSGRLAIPIKAPPPLPRPARAPSPPLQPFLATPLTPPILEEPFVIIPSKGFLIARTSDVAAIAGADRDVVFVVSSEPGVADGDGVLLALEE
ncbi:hypothetical protein HDU89_007764 [Geranomyces variabilis]|nr:hypothetical protein HDU89_007764 [Geranomyces variabilis]